MRYALYYKSMLNAFTSLCKFYRIVILRPWALGLQSFIPISLHLIYLWVTYISTIVSIKPYPMTKEDFVALIGLNYTHTSITSSIISSINHKSKIKYFYFSLCLCPFVIYFSLSQFLNISSDDITRTASFQSLQK